MVIIIWWSDANLNFIYPVNIEQMIVFHVTSL